MIHAEYERLKEKPEDCRAYTQVIITHPYHGTVILYVPAEEFRHIYGMIVNGWINSATILITPMED